METWVKVVFGVLLQIAACCCQLTVLTRDDGFLVSYLGKLVLDHSTNSPIVSLGSGNTSFEEYSGNFDIEDNVFSVLDLADFTFIDAKPELVRIELSNDASPDVGAEVILEVIGSLPNGSDYVTIKITPFATTPASINRLWFRLYAEEHEKVFGAGEQYTYFDLRGRDYPIWTREQGVGRGDGIVANVSNAVADAGGAYHTTYWPLPSFLSSRLYSALMENLNYLVLNFTAPNFHEVFVHSTSLNVQLLFEDSALALVQDLYRELGTQPPLPDWIIGGAILGLEEGTEEALGYYYLARDAGVNVSALWLQDWSGYIETGLGHRVYWNWAWNSSYYPGLDQVVEDLAAEGVRVTVYCNPHLIEGSPMFEEAAAGGHLMLDEDGEVFLMDFGGFLGGTVDVLDDDSMAWYADQLKTNILDFGFSGYMADFGEYTNVDMVSKNPNLNPEQAHNYFPTAWAITNRLAVEAAGLTGQAVYWMRSGGVGASTYQTLAWAGDQNVDFTTTDGVATTIVAALSLGLSGMGLTHFDIGGYTTQPPLVRTQELFLRSAEYSVFTPVMRTHLGNKPDANHQFYSSNETLAQFARLTQIHARLSPYTAFCVRQASELGIPAQRPLFLHYEAESEAWSTQEQYMYGPDLVVAPVIHRGQTSVEVYLPDDEWVHLFGVTSPVTGPSTALTDTPMGYPAVYYRRDSDFASLFQSITAEFGM